MTSKKLRKRLLVIGVTMGMIVGSMNVFASSYVTGHIPNHASITCTGSIGYSGKTMTAATGCNQAASIAYVTTIEGELKAGSVTIPLEDCTISNRPQKATLYSSLATGYVRGRGTHKVTYLGAYTWTGYTNM